MHCSCLSINSGLLAKDTVLYPDKECCACLRHTQWIQIQLLVAVTAFRKQGPCQLVDLGWAERRCCFNPMVQECH